MNSTEKAIARFHEKTIKGNGCWQWLGTFSASGYSQHYIGSRVIQGHLFAYEVLIGPRQSGTQLAHTCGNRWCVNPYHLAPRTIPLADRFWPKVAKTEDCWNWTGYSVLGYGRISLGARLGPVLATHVSWYLHHGEWPPRGSHLCHICDNPPCVNPSHLYIGNAETNCGDRERRGRGNQPRNERNGKCKWPSELVKQIRAAHGKMTTREASIAFAVPMGTIGNYWRGMRRRYC